MKERENDREKKIPLSQTKFVGILLSIMTAMPLTVQVLKEPFRHVYVCVCVCITYRRIQFKFMCILVLFFILLCSARQMSLYLYSKWFCSSFFFSNHIEIMNWIETRKRVKVSLSYFNFVAWSKIDQYMLNAHGKWHVTFKGTQKSTVIDIVYFKCIFTTLNG